MRFSAFTKIVSVLCLTLALASCDSEDSTARIVIGVGDKIFSTNALQYQFPAVVQLAGLDGSPVASTSVTISVRTISFFKGSQTFTKDTDGDATPDQWEPNIAITCTAEDTNNNGILDEADTNGNGRLDPNTPSITPHPDQTPTLIPGTAKLLTDSNGFGYFSLTYPKTESPWVRVQITATTQDGLVENRGVEFFTLLQAVEDIEDDGVPPAGLFSPYGTSADCGTII